MSFYCFLCEYIFFLQRFNSRHCFLKRGLQKHPPIRPSIPNGKLGRICVYGSFARVRGCEGAGSHLWLRYIRAAARTPSFAPIVNILKTIAETAPKQYPKRPEK